MHVDEASGPERVTRVPPNQDNTPESREHLVVPPGDPAVPAAAGCPMARNEGHIGLKPEQREQLVAVYCAERAEDVGANASAIALAGAAITYAIAATAFLSDKYGPDGFRGVPTWVQLLIPSIVTGLIGYFVLVMASTMLRAVHIKRLERALRITVEQDVPHRKTPTEPSFRSAADIIYKPSLTVLGVVYFLCTLATYGLIVIVLVVLTYGVLLPGPWTIGKVAVAVIYGVLQLAEGAGLLATLIHYRFKD